MNKRKHLPTLSDVSARVLYVRDAVAGGSNSELARRAGCSAGSISNIANSRNEPGASVLERIGQLPEVNSHWLKTGEGEPILDDRTILVATQLVPGPIAKNPHCFSMQRRAASLPYNTDSMYAIHVHSAMEPELQARLRFLPDDILVIETDLRARRRNIESLHRKLCCIQEKRKSGAVVRLEHVLVADAGSLMRTERKATSVPGRTRRIEFDSEPAEPMHSPPKQDLESIDLKAIVGVVVLSIREL